MESVIYAEPYVDLKLKQESGRGGGYLLAWERTRGERIKTLRADNALGGVSAASLLLGERSRASS